MAKFDNDISRAAALCIDRKVPFCLYRLPGTDARTVFFANPSMQGPVGGRRFIIGKWNEKVQDRIYIHDEWSAAQTIANIDRLPRLPATAVDPWPSTTPENEYLASVEALIGTIATEQLGKVVISRTKSLDTRLTAVDYVNIAQQLFEAFPKSFRHLYYTPSTGAWMGASPELILDYDSRDGIARTMALAGTRAASVCSPTHPWSEKDITEQRIVTDYITRELSRMGLKVECSQPYTLTTGNLQHIATDITGIAPQSNRPSPQELLDALNPTPALCGYPKSRAEELIEEIEHHQRHCYGGVVGEETDRHLKAYVNLRCLHFNSERLCIYAGGGILAESHAADEWVEAERKLNAIGQFFINSTI